MGEIGAVRGLIHLTGPVQRSDYVISYKEMLENKQTNKQTENKSKAFTLRPVFLARYGVTLLEPQNSQAEMVFFKLGASWSKLRIPRQPGLRRGTPLGGRGCHDLLCG